MDDEREKQLAEAFADLLDLRAAAGAAPVIPAEFPELTAELSALEEIDRALEPAPALPDRLSGHKIVDEIGSGGMGRVFLATDEALGRKVAVKTLSPRYAGNPDLRTRFMAEARAMARLNHPNIARIYSLGPAGEPEHFVMEYVEGVPLTKACSSLTFEQKAELMLKVVLAVRFLHEHGLVHRDLKPANILVGADLEPKLLDFGLALDLEEHERLSLIGEVVGTPQYLSPEQAAGNQTLDARSDIFSLGAVLYELLTGEPPFRGDTTADLLRRIRQEDPVLPRRVASTIPRDMQNICLKALEKDPVQRYASAGEMAADLRRFLADETVLAEPAAYARMITGKVAQHLRDLESWQRDQVISSAEYDHIRKQYDRLIEREDAWIMESRRLTPSQVTLYLGVWVLAVGAAFLTCFQYPALAGFPAVLITWGVTLPVAYIGIRTWRRESYRVAIAYLLAFCALVPISVLVTLESAHLFTGITLGQARFEIAHRLDLAQKATNAQLWWSLLAGLPICWWMRRFTRAPVFSLMLAVTGALLSQATLLRMGMIDWIENDPGRFYFHLIPFAFLFMAAGLILERRNLREDSRYFYPFAVVFTWAALSGVAAFHAPYAQWLSAVASWTRGQVEYLFILNAGIYFLLDRICDRTPSPQVRTVGKAFRFVIPGHVMTSLLLLGLVAPTAREAHVFEWLLPPVACIFVFASIPRQMKNFFASGLVFFAAGVFRLQQDVFNEHAFWPVFLLAAGLALMLAAANYAPLKIGLAKILKFNRR